MLAGELQQKKQLDKAEKRLEQQAYHVSKLELLNDEKNATIKKHEEKIEMLEGTNKYLMEEIHEKERTAKNATILYESLQQ